jgi:hypothetical protein
MYRFERICLYFFIFFLCIGWVTNPLMDRLVKLNIGIFGFLGLGTFLLLNFIHRNSEHKSLLNTILEIFISSLVILILLWFFIFLR